jgi:hypothetical protein
MTVSGVISRSVISQLTEGFSPHCHRHPLLFITTERQRKNNGENSFCFGAFTVCLLTIFSIKFQFSGSSHDPGYLSSQLDFCPAVAATRLHLLQQSGYVKIMVRIHFALTILQFVCSPFFN